MEGDPQILFWLMFIPHILLALSIHEASHAGSAYLLGDDTAALLGRVTLNPLRHIDPMGALAFILIHFGWAKPVPVNPTRFKNPRRDDLIVSLCGPASNLVLGLLFLVALRIIWEFNGGSASQVAALPEWVKTGAVLLFVGAQLNVGLCFFNLIPVPPLDGSHIITAVLPDSMADTVEPFLRHGWLILLALILLSSVAGIHLFGIIIGVPMRTVVGGVLGGVSNADGLMETLNQFFLLQ